MILMRFFLVIPMVSTFVVKPRNEIKRKYCKGTSLNAFEIVDFIPPLLFGGAVFFTIWDNPSSTNSFKKDKLKVINESKKATEEIVDSSKKWNEELIEEVTAEKTIIEDVVCAKNISEDLREEIIEEAVDSIEDSVDLSESVSDEKSNENDDTKSIDKNDSIDSVPNILQNLDNLKMSVANTVEEEKLKMDRIKAKKMITESITNKVVEISDEEENKEVEKEEKEEKVVIKQTKRRRLIKLLKKLVMPWRNWSNL